MSRQPLKDISHLYNIQNGPETSPASSPETERSGDADEIDHGDGESISSLERQQSQIAVSSGNWKIMDNDLLTRFLYARIPHSPLDAENLRDFYIAKRNGWLDAESPSFLFETLFRVSPTCDLTLYSIRQSMFTEALKRYQCPPESMFDLNFTIALGKQ